MRILKRVLFIIAIIIAIPFIAALLMKKTFVVEREIIIDKPRQEVFTYVKNLRNQPHYSNWAMRDPDMKASYTGADGEVGSTMAWESPDPNVGKGELAITNLVDGERVDVEIRFTEPFVSTNPVSTITEPLSDTQTKVKSVYQGTMPYPTNLMCAIVEDIVAKEMESSLANLTGVLEMK